jgi:hypothetical protein
LLNAMATHPPLEERIRAIDPGWDGKYPRVAPPEVEASPEHLLKQRPRGWSMPPLLPLPGTQPGASGFAPRVERAQAVQPHAILPSLGKPTPMHLRYAGELRNSFPEAVKTAAREGSGAMVLVYALLLSRDETQRAQQLNGLGEKAGVATQERVSALLADVDSVSGRARLPLVELAIPALRLLSPDEFQRFNATLKWLVESDDQIDLFEFVLQKIIQRHLEPYFGQVRRNVVQYYTLRPLVPDCAVLLSALAQVASSDEGEVRRAFDKGIPYLRAQDGPITLLSRDRCALDQIDVALNRLSQAVPQIKKNLIEASVQVVGADGVIQEHEAELLRAMADALDCPIPPFVTVD